MSITCCFSFDFEHTPSSSFIESYYATLIQPASFTLPCHRKSENADVSIRTMVQDNQKPKRKYWATCLSVYSFAHIAHSFTCCALLAALARSAALTCSRAPLRSLARMLRCAHLLACSTTLTCSLAHSLARGTVNDKMAIYSVFFSFLAHSALLLIQFSHMYSISISFLFHQPSRIT